MVELKVEIEIPVRELLASVWSHSPSHTSRPTHRQTLGALPKACSLLPRLSFHQSCLVPSTAFSP